VSSLVYARDHPRLKIVKETYSSVNSHDSREVFGKTEPFEPNRNDGVVCDVMIKLNFRAIGANEHV